MNISPFLLDFLFPRSTETKRADEILQELSTRPLPRSPWHTEAKHGSNRALFAYRDDRVRALIHSFKYRHRQDIATYFASALREQFTHMNLPNGTIIDFVPVRRARRSTIGYSQGDLILNALRKNIDTASFDVSSIMLRSHEIEAQTSLRARADRLSNMNRVFVADPRVQGCTIVIIDDVTTTGATFADVRRALMEAGADRIECIALAH